MKKILRRTFCLLLVAVLGFLSTGTAVAQKGYDKALKAKRQSQGKLFNNADVVATGVSFDQQGNAFIKVFVKNDKAKGIPAKIDGVRVERVVSGEFSAYDDTKKQARGGKGKPGGGDASTNPRQRFDRAVPIGVSIGSTGPNICFAGTLGCRVRRVNFLTGEVDYFILSNNHVIAEENDGVLGGDFVIQPGTLDNDCVLDFNDIIGTLSDFVVINFNGGANSVDAAIASTTPAETGFATPADAYGAPTSTTVQASTGMLVKKFGRTTGYTEGIVDSINVDVNVGYDKGTALFTDQIIIQGRTRKGKRFVASEFSAGGDSGSLIVEQNSNNPVGLLFAGNSSFTIANPINEVLDSFSDENVGTMLFVDDGN